MAPPTIGRSFVRDAGETPLLAQFPSVTFARRKMPFITMVQLAHEATTIAILIGVPAP